MYRMLLTATALLLAASTQAGAPSNSAGITPDGHMDDWGAIAQTASDPSGDASGSDDYTGLWVADDGEHLALRFSVANETLLQRALDSAPGNDYEILIDGDGNAATGASIQGIGAELRIRLGDQEGTFFRANGSSVNLTNLNEIELQIGPSHTATEFEIVIPFSTATRTLISGPTVKIVFSHNSGHDRMPDSGSVEYELSGTVLGSPEIITVAKDNGTDIRLYNQNVERSSFLDNPAPFIRMMQATNPDIIALQEQYTGNEQDVLTPIQQGLGWENGYAAKVHDCVVVSRWPILNSAPVGNTQNLVAHIDLPDDRSAVDLVLFSVHTPCCDNEAGRDAEHDAIAATWRDLMGGDGPFTIDPADAVIQAGDFNMVGYVRQLHTVQDGDIIDNKANGPDYSPARSAGSLEAAPSRHTHSRSVHTWRSPGSSFLPGRLDFILFSGDVMALKKNFTFNLEEYSAQELSDLGLQPGDIDAADHLPMIADFQFAVPGPNEDALVLY